MLSTNIRHTISNVRNRDTLTVSKTEKARKKVVKYIFVVYWLLIFEGALRKWAFPNYHEFIFFARDPVVLLIYFIAWRNHIFKRDGLLTAGMVMSILFLALMFVQVIVINMNMFTLIYGWRMYFFYLPLAFVIKDAFSQEDVFRLIRQTLYVCVPLSVLVYFQYISPPSSFVNAAYSTGHVFVVSGNIVRTTGTFTFTAGQTMFAASLMAMLVIAWLYRKRFPLLSMPWLIIATVAALTTLLLTGSRTAFFMTGLIVLATFYGLLFTRSIKFKFAGTVLLLFLLIVGTLMFMGPLKKSFDALGTRFEQAERSEGSAIRRAFAPLLIFTRHITTSPVIGYGLGLGTSGGSKLATGKAQLILAEDEWSRVLMEAGPAFGLAYIVYRIIFSLLILKLCMKNARDDNNLLPMIIFGFIGYYMIAGQITHQGTIQGYNWIFMGLVMAAARRQISKDGANV